MDGRTEEPNSLTKFLSPRSNKQWKLLPFDINSKNKFMDAPSDGQSQKVDDDDSHLQKRTLCIMDGGTEEPPDQTNQSFFITSMDELMNTPILLRNYLQMSPIRRTISKR